LWQVKIAILQYLQGLIGLMDPSDFTNSGGILLFRYNFKSKYKYSAGFYRFLLQLLFGYSKFVNEARVVFVDFKKRSWLEKRKRVSSHLRYTKLS